MDAGFIVLDDEAAVAHGAAEWFVTAVRSVRSPVAVCLSGGSTPRALYALLASDAYAARVPWPHLHWFWGDERFVPHDDPRSNYGMARAALLDRAPVPPANIHPVDTSLPDPQAAAAAYQRALVEFREASRLVASPTLFIATLLGVGPDGHTASLFPGSPLLDESERWVAASIGERPETRITLTYPALDRSGAIAFLACGSEKKPILADIVAGADVPAARVRPIGTLTWFVDRAAAPDR